MTLELDPGKTALVLIDLQGGTLGFPLAPYDGPALIAASERLGRRFAAASALIVTVRVSFSPDGGDRLTQPTDIPMRLPPGGMPPEWSRLDPRIAALPAAVSITKRQWSAFHGTELDLQLRRRGITTIVLGGIATNFGVESTARDAWQNGYAVVIAEDACSSLGADLHSFAIEKTLPRVARISGVDAVCAALA